MMLAFAICVIGISAAVEAQLMDCPLNEDEIFKDLDKEPVPETTFELYTRNNRHFYQELVNETSVIHSNYDPQKRTVLLLHGYVGDPSFLFMLKFAYLLYMDCNVIMVNWKIGASEQNYLIAARNVPIIAMFVAKKLEQLKDITGCRFKDFHLVGWSLGAQLAGLIGKYVTSEIIGRITGLDPCGVCFEGFSVDHKLHFKDANLVDTIITNRGAVIVNEPTGHLNFLPDGGSLARGCCHISDGQLWSEIIPLQKCSHYRAVELFAASLKNTNCLFVGFQCPDYATFEMGECFDCGIDQKNCAVMGIHADSYAIEYTNETKTFYFDTTSTYGFCLFQYHVEVVIDNRKDSTDEVGIMNLFINRGTSEEIEIMLKPSANKMQHPEYLIPGEIYTYLVHSNHNIHPETVKSVEFFWVSYSNEKDSKLYIRCVTIVPMNNPHTLQQDMIFATARNVSIAPEVETPLQITQGC